MPDHKLEILLAARDVTKSAFLSAQGRVKAFTKSVFSMRGAMVAAAGAGAMGVFIKKSLESADAIGKASDAIGISTDTLQEYRHAARIAGVSTEALDKSILQFAKRFGKAKVDTGAMITYLKKYDEVLLGNIKTAKSTDDALKMVFDRMGQMANAADRAALADAAFGRAGLKMTVMVKDGAAGLAKMRQEARDLGIVMNNQLIRSSEKANDELEKLTRVLKVQFMRVGAGLAPEIARMAESTTRWLTTSDDFIDSIESIGSALVTTVSLMGQFTRRMKGIYGFRWDDKLNAPAIDWKKTTRMAAPGFDFGMMSRELAGGPAGGGAGAGTDWAKTTRMAQPGFDFKMMNRELAEESDLMRDLAAAQQEYADALIKGGGTGKIMENQLRRGVGDSVKAFQEGYSVLENLSQRTAEAMEQNFSDFYFDVMKNEFDSLSDYANAIFDSIRRATADIMGQMTKDFLFSGGSSGSSGFLSSAMKWGASAFLGGGGAAADPYAWGGSAQGFQHGGRFGKDELIRVGEAGPELLYTGNRNGQVIPNHKLGDKNLTVHSTLNVHGDMTQRAASLHLADVERKVRDVLKEEMR